MKRQSGPISNNYHHNNKDVTMNHEKRKTRGTEQKKILHKALVNKTKQQRKKIIDKIFIAKYI